jgi:NitT/TauT family transport system substrate-binding protein
MLTRVRPVHFCALAATAVALLCSSCGGSGATSGSSGTVSITVGALPVIDDVGLYIAQDEGIFQRDGLNVTIAPVASSAVAISEMKAGKISIIGGGNDVSFIQLASSNPANPPFKLLSEAATCAPGAFEVLVLPDSGIQTPAQLQHKTIAVNIPNNIQTLTINSVLQADDVSTASVRYKPIAFPLMVAALKAHKVDAISEVEPFATQAQQAAGAEPVLDQCTGPTNAIPLSGYFAPSAWAQQHPDLVQRFQQAMTQAQDIADTNRAEVEKALLTYVPKLSEVQAATIALDQFPTATDTVQLNRVANLMFEAGLIHTSFQTSSLVQG